MRAFSRFLPLTAAPERGRESAWLAQETQGPKWQCSYLRAQYEAGERLRAAYWFAHMNPRVTSNWSAFAPQDRARRGAPSNSAALRDEVIGGGGAGGLRNPGRYLLRVERSRGGREGKWLAGRARKVVLQIALTRLAKHYGLI